jgi:hypothetical protein
VVLSARKRANDLSGLMSRHGVDGNTVNTFADADAGVSISLIIMWLHSDVHVVSSESIVSSNSSIVLGRSSTISG